jgi:hypothetical protein
MQQFKIKIAVFTCITILLLVFSACKKTAGEGGNSSIRGTVWV